MDTQAISLKALVDKEKNKVVFVEAETDFLDVLFSFLTMPMGTIVKLTAKDPPTTRVGCMNNLYASVEKMDKKYFRTNLCRIILLHPQNAAGDEYKNLKLKIDDSKPSRYFLCQRKECTTSSYKLVSNYENSVCDCGYTMGREIKLSVGKQNNFNSDAREGGTFVKGLVRQLVTDDLQLLLASTTSSIGLLSRLGRMNYDDFEERTFGIGVNEVLGLLKYSLISNTPLTTILLKPEALPAVPDLRKEDVIKSKHTGYQKQEEHVSDGGKQISIKLVISKSERKVCYAEAGEDFVNLLFSFLSIPLGYILKEMCNERSKGCINCLYKSVQDLDADKYMKSNGIKNLLLSPKIAPCHSYMNHPLALEEVERQFYYASYSHYWEMLTTDAENVPSDGSVKVFALTLKDPKSPSLKATSIGSGYVRGPATFTISDDLEVVPISPVSVLSNLKKMKVPFHDIEEQVVNVSKEEALRLLIAAFCSDSALTSAFLHRQINNEEHCMFSPHSLAMASFSSVY